jgi:hypothetical protein
LFVHGDQRLREALVAQAALRARLDEFSSYHVPQQEYQKVLGKPAHGRLPRWQVFENFLKQTSFLRLAANFRRPQNISSPPFKLIVDPVV